MKWVALAAAAVVSAWAGSAGAGTVLYSLSGIVGDGPEWAQPFGTTGPNTELYLTDLPVGNIAIEMTAPGLTANVGDDELYENYNYGIDVSRVQDGKLVDPGIAVDFGIASGTQPVLQSFGGLSVVYSDRLFQSVNSGNYDNKFYFTGTYPDAPPNSLFLEEDYQSAFQTVFDEELAPIAVGQPFSLEVMSVPEPETWALMILGLASAGILLRSRRVQLATHSYRSRPDVRTDIPAHDVQNV